MKTRALSIALAAAAALSALSARAFTEGIAYSGRLQAVNAAPFDGTQPITMTFCLYSEAEGGNILWGRRIPVVVARDGTFDTVLHDAAGSDFAGTGYKSLVEAVSSVSASGDLYIGLTVGNCGNLADIAELEFKPRQRIGTTPFAQCAAKANKVGEMTGLAAKLEGLHVMESLTTPNFEVTGTGPNSQGLVSTFTPTLELGENAELYAENGSFSFSNFTFPRTEIVSQQHSGTRFQVPAIVLKKSSDDSLMTDIIPANTSITTDPRAQHIIQVVGQQ